MRGLIRKHGGVLGPAPGETRAVEAVEQGLRVEIAAGECQTRRTVCVPEPLRDRPIEHARQAHLARLRRRCDRQPIRRRPASRGSGVPVRSAGCCRASTVCSDAVANQSLAQFAAQRRECRFRCEGAACFVRQTLKRHHPRLEARPCRRHLLDDVFAEFEKFAPLPLASGIGELLCVGRLRPRCGKGGDAIHVSPSRDDLPPAPQGSWPEHIDAFN